eukprot:TRINITY_DN2044_c1_g2_i1.p1 TRINITY_DN2044_c1_g2~~TRINITY_DN2044_c1_g2_i1.p1  ORF type:complete len:1208 (-),score=324.64 TRINITY_DN2044_c1_g2_i1:36-3659(-)
MNNLNLFKKAYDIDLNVDSTYLNFTISDINLTRFLKKKPAKKEENDKEVETIPPQVNESNYSYTPMESINMTDNGNYNEERQKEEEIKQKMNHLMVGSNYYLNMDFDDVGEEKINTGSKEESYDIESSTSEIETSANNLGYSTPAVERIHYQFMSETSEEKKTDSIIETDNTPSSSYDVLDHKKIQTNNNNNNTEKRKLHIKLTKFYESPLNHHEDQSYHSPIMFTENSSTDSPKYMALQTVKSVNTNDNNDNNRPTNLLFTSNSIDENLTRKEFDFGKYHWVKEFYYANDIDSPEKHYENISKIGTRFVECAEFYGRIIISEKNLPNDLKTIKPTDLGGIAGGDKFSVQGIIFKFALDVKINREPEMYLYGGTKSSTENSRKAAGRELVSLESILTVGVKGMYLPLMSLVDFKGYRLICVSKLPILRDTIIYGSCDGGRNVHSSPLVSKQMRDLADKLNLKGHQVGVKETLIHGPGDIEVHLGEDSNYYLIDFGRLMPPEAPPYKARPGKKRNWIFYQHLRPEFVNSYKTKLCSDTFSGWDLHDPQRHEHQKDIIQATDYLHYKVASRAAYHIDLMITEHFAKNFDDSRPNKMIKESVKAINVSSILHSFGLNVRHLGRVRKFLKPNRLNTRALLLENAVARVIKNIMNKRMRQLMGELKYPCDEPFKVLIAEFLNIITMLDKDKAKVKKFWDQTLMKRLNNTFFNILTDPSESELEIIQNTKKDERQFWKEHEENLQNEIKKEKMKTDKEEKFIKSRKKSILNLIPSGFKKHKEKLENSFLSSLTNTKNLFHVRFGKNDKDKINNWAQKIMDEESIYTFLKLPILSLIRIPFVFYIFLEITGIKLTKRALKSFKNQKNVPFSYNDIEKLETKVKQTFNIELASGIRRLFEARKEENKSLQLRILKEAAPFLQRCLARGSLNPVSICAVGDVFQDIADNHKYQKQTTKALKYYKMACSYYTQGDRKTNHLVDNWAVIKNNEAICLFKYYTLLYDNMDLTTSTSFKNMFEECVEKRDYILKTRHLSNEIFWNEKLLWMTSTDKNSKSRAFNDCASIVPRKIILEGFLLLKIKNGWVNHYVAVVEVSDFDQTQPSMDLKKSFNTIKVKQKFVCSPNKFFDEKFDFDLNESVLFEILTKNQKKDSSSSSQLYLGVNDNFEKPFICGSFKLTTKTGEFVFGADSEENFNLWANFLQGVLDWLNYSNKDYK